MTRYSLLVMFIWTVLCRVDNALERYYNAKIFFWFLFCPLSSAQFKPPATILALRGVSQENLTIRIMISMTITMIITFTVESGGISCKAVWSAGCVSCDVHDQLPSPGWRASGWSQRSWGWRAGGTCPTLRIEPHALQDKPSSYAAHSWQSEKKRYFKPSYCSSGFCWILQSSVAKKWDGGLKWAIWASIGPYNSISPLAEASSDVSNE